MLLELAQVEFPDPGDVQGQAGTGYVQRDPAVYVPPHCSGHELSDI